MRHTTDIDHVVIAIWAVNVARRPGWIGIRIPARRCMIIPRLIGIDCRADQRSREQPGAGPNRSPAATRRPCSDERAAGRAKGRARSRRLARITGVGT